MQARGRLGCVAFWLRNGWRKPATEDLVVVNDRYWVALFCDALVRDVAGWSSMERNHGLRENVIRALNTDLKACLLLRNSGFVQLQG